MCSHAQELNVIDKVDSLITNTRDLVSEQSFEQALKSIELAEELSKDSLPVLYARCLYNHGRTHLYALQYSKAIPFFKQAMAIQEKEIGRETADFAYSLTGLANSLRELGQYEKAMPLYIESKDIRKDVLGLNHPSYASAVNNLAILQWEMGEYKKTEELLLESKRIRFESVGSEHEDYAYSLFNLAVLYGDMGAYSRAEKLILECINIIELKLGAEHPDYSDALQALASVYLNTGEFKKAEFYFIESMNIWETVHGVLNEDYLSYQANLAELYLIMGQFKKAESLFEKILDNQDKLPEKNLHLNALALYNLGSFYWDTKQYEKVALIFEECKILMEQVLGKEHHEYSIVLNSLAEIYEIELQHDNSEELLFEASKLQQIRLLNAISFLSEKELSEYIRVFEGDLFRMLNILEKRQRNMLDPSKLAGLCYDNILFYKGFLLSAARQINSLSNSTPESKELNNQLNGYKRLLAKAYATPKIYRDSSEISEIEFKVNKLEKEIANEVFNLDQISKHIKWKDLKNKLHANEVAIEFIHYNSHPHDELQAINYAAILIDAHSKEPQFIPLFKEKELAEVLNSNIESKNSSFNKMYTRGAKVMKRTNYEGLYDLVWKPLMPHLDNFETVRYSPSGILHRISFDAIHVEDGEHLTDLFQLVRYGSTSSFVLASNQSSTKGQEAALYGGILYDLSIDQKVSLGAWSYLEGTQKEVNEISKILEANGFQVNMMTKASASEESFKELSKERLSPKILHIATHGYFYPEPELIPVEEQLENESIAFKRSSHPLVRSGLLLAGANHTWTGSQLKDSDKEDGVLTAYEISQMDLNNTELVVLSACETGLGDILGNEGVYGLQRALKIAGAKNLIISLWKVPDKETSMLMRSFYSNWLGNKSSIRQALTFAQKELRDLGYDPYYWAGFILLE